MVDCVSKKYKLLITIVNKGIASKVVRASKRVGCEGGTILPGTGTGIHEKSSFFGLNMNPEKEVVFSLVPQDEAEHILNAISKAAKLGIAGNGIAFVVNVRTATGIAHMIETQIQD